jgi:hypothetical protein
LILHLPHHNHHPKYPITFHTAIDQRHCNQLLQQALPGHQANSVKRLRGKPQCPLILLQRKIRISAGHVRSVRKDSSAQAPWSNIFGHTLAKNRFHVIFVRSGSPHSQIFVVISVGIVGKRQRRL